MRVSITREPTKAASNFAPRYEYQMGFRSMAPYQNWPSYIQFGFSTERPGVSNTSNFTGYIMPNQFAELAQLMFDTDSQAAIRAFGQVMQGANIAHAVPKNSESIAA
jgi:hypothetical protein